MENKNITSLKSFSKNNKINIITSFPKSGSTWMRFIIYDLFFNNDNIKVESSSCVKDKIPDFHNLKLLNEKNFDDFLKGKYIFFKTHFSYEQMKMLSINKIIILIRNPIDIFISLLNFYEIDKDQKEEMLNYFCLHQSLPFLKERFKFPNWKGHIESWVNSGKDFHIVKYSDLIDDFENEIKKLCFFLDLEITDKKISFIKENTKFENLKNIEILERKKNLGGFFVDAMEGKKSHFINTGGRKNYQNLFEKFELKKIYNSFEKELAKFQL